MATTDELLAEFDSGVSTSDLLAEFDAGNDKPERNLELPSYIPEEQAAIDTEIADQKRLKKALVSRDERLQEEQRQKEWGDVSGLDIASDLAASPLRGLVGATIDAPSHIGNIGLMGLDWIGENVLGQKPLDEPVRFPLASEAVDYYGEKATGIRPIESVTAPRVKKGLYAPLDYANTFLEIGAGGTIAGTRNVIRQSQNRIGAIAANTTPEVMSAVPTVAARTTADFVRGAKLDIAAGGGAVAGGILAGDTGEIVGSLLAPASASTSASLANRFRKNMDADIQMARDAIDRQVDDPNRLREILADESGNAGTMGVISGDRGLIDLEARSARNPQTRNRIEEADAAFDAETQRRLNEQGGVSPEEFGRSTRPLLDKSIAKIEKEQEALIEKARVSREAGIKAEEANVATLKEERAFTEQEANAALDKQFAAQMEAKEAKEYARELKKTTRPESLTSKASKDLVEASETARKDSKEAYGKLWDEFDGAVPISSAKVKAIVEESKAGLNPTELAMMESEFNAVLKHIDNFEGKIQPREVHTIISKLKQINENARSGTTSTYTITNKNLNKVVKGLEDALDEVGNSGEAYTAARDATAQHFKNFGKTRLAKDIRTKAKAEVLDPASMTGTKGATLIDDLEVLTAQTPKAPAYVRQAIKEAASGNYTSDVTDKFLRNYNEILQRFPDVRNELESLRDAQIASGAASDAAKLAATKSTSALSKAKGARSALKSGERTADVTERALTRTVKSAERGKEKALKTLQKTQLAKIAKEPKKFLDSILSEDTSYVSDIIKKAVQATENPDQLRRAIMDRFSKKKGTATEGTSSTVSSDAYAEFGKIRDSLVESGLFKQAEIDKIAKDLARSEYKVWRKNARPTQDMSMSSLDGLKGSAIAVMAMKTLPVKSSLMVAGAIRRLAMSNIKFEGRETALSKMILDEMLTNPAAYLDPDKLELSSIEKAVQKAYNKAISKGMIPADMVKSNRRLTKSVVAGQIDTRLQEDEEK